MASTHAIMHAARVSDFEQHPSASPGIGVDDLPLINRALFDHAVRAATDLHDPSSDPESFIMALWTLLANAFEWSPQPWPQETPLPALPDPSRP